MTRAEASRARSRRTDTGCVSSLIRLGDHATGPELGLTALPESLARGANSSSARLPFSGVAWLAQRRR
jgi:hypothetical protein